MLVLEEPANLADVDFMSSPEGERFESLPGERQFYEVELARSHVGVEWQPRCRRLLRP